MTHLKGVSAYDRHAPPRHVAAPSLARAAASLAAALLCDCAFADEPRPLTQPVTPELAAVVQAALEDAARSSGVAGSKIELQKVERVTWLDGSLGCPEPGVLYTQALVNGLRLQIQAGSKSLDYHTDLHDEVLACPPQRNVAPASSAVTSGRQPAAPASTPVRTRPAS